MLAVEAIKTRIFKTGEPILVFLFDELKKYPLRENDVVCVTSKIVSLSENRIVKNQNIEKTVLVRREADHYLADGPFGVSLTIKHGLMIPSAGIDESNADGKYFILYPLDPFQSARAIWAGVKNYFHLQNVGIILTDSHTQPLRRGVTGIALSYWGFRGVNNCVGKDDLFGRKLKYTTVHAADALATAAVFEMGESNESQPLAVISGANVHFQNEIDPAEGSIAPQDDLYFSLYQSKIE